jgi:hypothetical protein
VEGIDLDFIESKGESEDGIDAEDTSSGKGFPTFGGSNGMPFGFSSTFIFSWS